MCGESWWVGTFPASRPGEALRDAFLKTFTRWGSLARLAFLLEKLLPCRTKKSSPKTQNRNHRTDSLDDVEVRIYWRC